MCTLYWTVGVIPMEYWRSYRTVFSHYTEAQKTLTVKTCAETGKQTPHDQLIAKLTFPGTVRLNSDLNCRKHPSVLPPNLFFGDAQTET